MIVASSYFSFQWFTNPNIHGDSAKSLDEVVNQDPQEPVIELDND